MGARETALNALIACRKEGAWSNGILKEYVRRDALDRRDAALAARLCYGVMQNRNRMDHYLAQLLTGKVRDLHPAIRDILHLGLYQILEMDKIPTSAAVNESVILAKKYCRKQKFAPGLVNAVLRNAVRSADHLQPPKTLSARYSHPEKLIALLRQSVGPELLEPMLQANNTIAPMTVQVNTRKTTTAELTQRLVNEGVGVEKHSWMADCLVLQNTGDLEQLDSFREGLFYVQDPAAKLAVLCAGVPQEHIELLDCCSAPGGKSFAAAIVSCGLAKITSCDIHSHKTELIQKGARRLDLQNITARCQDATEFVPEWENKMDFVIADVPCSGYGIIRKKPDIREKDPEQMASLPELQLRILENQGRYVKPGGVLLYATCTVLRRENEDVVLAFLAKNPAFRLEKLELPAIFPENENGMLTLVPGQYDTDGFFIAKLRRKQ